MSDRELFDGVVCFVEVARRSSFRGAASALGVTPAAVSRTIARLEERLGVELLHRTTRSVRLSTEGELFFASCQAAVGELQLGVARIERAREEARGEVRVTLSRVLGGQVVAGLPPFARLHPGVELHLSLSDEHVDLVSGGFDVALRIGTHAAGQDLVTRRIATTRWVTVASPSYIARMGRPGSPEDVRGHACLAFAAADGKPAPWWWADDEGERTRWRPEPTLSLDDGRALVDAARAGLGITQAFGFLVDEAIARGELVEVLAPWSCEGPHIHALTHASARGLPRIRALLDHLVDVFADAQNVGDRLNPTR